jgi:hypothetical protein
VLERSTLPTTERQGEKNGGRKRQQLPRRKQHPPQNYITLFANQRQRHTLTTGQKLRRKTQRPRRATHEQLRRFQRRLPAIEQSVTAVANRQGLRLTGSSGTDSSARSSAAFSTRRWWVQQRCPPFVKSSDVAEQRLLAEWARCKRVSFAGLPRKEPQGRHGTRRLR